MNDSLPRVRTLAFGVFEADLQAQELRRKGKKVRLPDQSFQVLAMLLEHPGELVTREGLRGRLWAGDTFVDFDHGLNNAVNRLREALEDSAESPRFIETLPRRGYRFIGTISGNGATSAVSLATQSVSVGAGQVLEKAESGAQRKSGWLWMTGLAVATTAGLLIASLTVLKNPVRPSSRSYVLPPEGTTFLLIRDSGGPVTLSGDGTKLAFVVFEAKGISRIWIRPLGSLTAQALEGTEGATFPFWSPDGRWIAFFSDAERKLKKINLAGGPAVSLCDAQNGRGGSWSPRGVILFAPNPFASLYEVPDSGGEPAPVTKVDTAIHTSHRWPKFLPDGRHFIYLAVSHRHDASRDGIYVGSLEGKESKRIVASHADATYASGYLFYLLNDVLMVQGFDPRREELQGEARATIEKVVYDPSIWKAVFDVSEHGVMAYELGGSVRGSQFTWFDRSGKLLGVVGEPGFNSTPTLSPDGRKMAAGRVVQFGHYSDLWVYDLARGLSTRITFEDEYIAGGIWSSDGDRILFRAKGQKHSAIYAVDPGGAGRKEKVLERETDIEPSDVSRDGRFLLYGASGGPEPGRGSLWVASMKGIGSPFLVVHNSQGFGRFSPDGRWIAYTSHDSGRDEVYVVPFPPQTASRGRTGANLQSRWQISSAGGNYPRWRGDGRELFFVAADGAMMSASVNSQTGKFEASAARPLFRPGAIYDVSRDGNRFILDLGFPPDTKAPITLVENWLSDFKKQ